MWRCHHAVMSVRNLESSDRCGERLPWNQSCSAEVFPPFRITRWSSCPRESSSGLRCDAWDYDSELSSRCAKLHSWKTWGPVLPTWMPLTLLVSRESYFICDLNFCLDGEVSRASPAWLTCWTTWCHYYLHLFLHLNYLHLFSSLNCEPPKGWAGAPSVHVCMCAWHMHRVWEKCDR